MINVNRPQNRYFLTIIDLGQKLVRRFNRYQGNPAALKRVLGSFANRHSHGMALQTIIKKICQVLSISENNIE